MKLSVVIPVYNEAATILDLLEKVKQVDIDKEIILIDDCSVDGTRKVLEKIDDPNIRVFYHRQNQGKGAAIRTGFAEVRGQITIIQDADLEYDPNEYLKLVQPILDGVADVVYGSRFAGSSKRVLNFWHTQGNKFLTRLSNMFTNLDLTDMETCYKVFKSDIIKNLHLVSNRFGIEPEMTAKISKLNYRIYEIPISYHGRSYIQGKKIGWKDGVSAIYSIIKFSFSSRLTKTGTPMGYQIVNQLTSSERYNEWLLEKIKPQLGKRIFEIGSGIGYLAKSFTDRDHIILSDYNDEYLDYLKKIFGGKDQISIRKYDLADLPTGELQNDQLDTILCLRVLEYIKDDQKSLQSLFEILKPSGTLVLMVPALKMLYGSLDKSLEHHRRYEKEELVEKLEKAGFKVESVEYHNWFGIIGWYFNTHILKRTKMPVFQIKLFDLIVPLLKFESKLQLNSGLNLLVFAKKPENL